MKKKVTVLGSGSWGTALASHLAHLGRHPTLWDVNSKVLDEIQSSGRNTKYHPGLELGSPLSVEKDLKKAIEKSEILVFSIPSYSIRETLKKLETEFWEGKRFVSCAKGLETDSHKTVSQVFADCFSKEFVSENFAVLSGPSFAHEVVRNLPTAVTIASENQKTREEIQDLFHGEKFKAFTSDDVIGVEIAGALKNVIAIATGASDGLEFGHNTRAAIITRGLAEISRIGRAMGAHPLTFSGLSGLGDLILTCAGDLSRNRRVGLKLAQGKSLRTVLKEVGQVAEGIRTTKAAYLLARELGVDTPIIDATYETLYKSKPLEEALRDLYSIAPEIERDH